MDKTGLVFLLLAVLLLIWLYITGRLEAVADVMAGRRFLK